MILADSSAWIEYDRATGSSVDWRVQQLIESEAALAVTEPVVMEVLAGARDDKREADLRRLLLRCIGVTPRGMVDCMIAAVAWRHEAALLARDADLQRVAQVMGIPVDVASTEA